MDARATLTILLLGLTLGCDSHHGAVQTRLPELHVQERSARNELALWQAELDRVNAQIDATPKPGTRIVTSGGVAGYSMGPPKQLLRRRDQLLDKVVEVKTQLGRIEAEEKELGVSSAINPTPSALPSSAVNPTPVGSSANDPRTQDSTLDLEQIYSDHSHCVLDSEVHSEDNSAISCRCRDAIADTQYVRQTYLVTGKDRNLIGAEKWAQESASRWCGEHYDLADIMKATSDAHWKWVGPKVVRKFPSDREIAETTPDSTGGRAVEYEVKVIRLDPQGRPLATKPYKAIWMFSPKDSSHPE